MAGGKKSDKWKAGGGKKGKGTKGEGKKKGGKKKAKPKLSEDAKNRQQEQRAAVEEERRRMREELINSFLRVRYFQCLLAEEKQTLITLIV
jgi:hypothetical protein